MYPHNTYKAHSHKAQHVHTYTRPHTCIAQKHTITNESQDSYEHTENAPIAHVPINHTHEHTLIYAILDNKH